MDADTSIVGKRISFRTLKEGDASLEYASWLNDVDVNKYLETKCTTVEALRDYIRQRRAAPDCLFVGMFLNDTGRHIGDIMLEPIDRQRKKATMGMLAGDKQCWKKGYATEALQLLADWAFEHLGLNEIDLSVLRENAAAIKAYQKTGYAVTAETPKDFTITKCRLRLALGTVQFGMKYVINNVRGQLSREDSLAMLKQAYARGICVFDTAIMYGDAEQLLRAFIAQELLQKDVAIISKLKPNIFDNPFANVTTTVLKEAQTSQHRLGMAQLDGYLLHTPAYIKKKEVVAALRVAKEKNLCATLALPSLKKRMHSTQQVSLSMTFRFRTAFSINDCTKLTSSNVHDRMA